ncbi:cytochrome C oxidase subunit IV family protein [Paenibacillus sp. KN14-4R]|uniref:cytochrome C oxidase subunit IV family protein n=1 Tax=Paenibacillus sp. KN14-4R TaxID=3445773 RepID=UPI003FA0064B
MEQVQNTASSNRRRKPESPAPHFLSYIVSILLTMLAFAVVIYGDLDRSFILIFIFSLAIIQVIFQLAYWMHMKERGHVYAAIGLIFGFIIALTAVAAAVYWTWW